MALICRACFTESVLGSYLWFLPPFAFAPSFPTIKPQSSAMSSTDGRTTAYVLWSMAAFASIFHRRQWTSDKLHVATLFFLSVLFSFFFTGYGEMRPGRAQKEIKRYSGLQNRPGLAIIADIADSWSFIIYFAQNCYVQSYSDTMGFPMCCSNLQEFPKFQKIRKNIFGLFPSKL